MSGFHGEVKSEAVRGVASWTNPGRLWNLAYSFTFGAQSSVLSFGTESESIQIDVCIMTSSLASSDILVPIAFYFSYLRLCLLYEITLSF